MIVAEIYNGEGLGNQLARYITTRVIATDNGYDFGFQNIKKFKGLDFFDLNFGHSVSGGCNTDEKISDKLPEEIKYYYLEKKIVHPENGTDIRLFDIDLTRVKDNTKIEGVMQDEQYMIHRKDEIREWLKVKNEFECYEYSDDNICVINFRGGEYTRHKELYLEKKYWENSVKNMLKINKNFRFVVITDDVFAAKKFFRDYEVLHFNIAKDYVIIKNAKYLILSNSSFAWFPAWLNENLKFCIAPKYWARHNISDGYWALGYNITTGWMYQDKNGNLSDYDTCKKEFNEYIIKNKHLFDGSISYSPTNRKKIYLYLKNELTPKWLKKIVKNILTFFQNLSMRLKNYDKK